MESGYNGKIVRKKIRKQHPSKYLLKREKIEPCEQKLPFFKKLETYYKDSICQQLLIMNILKYFLMDLLQNFVIARALKTNQSDMLYLKLMKPGDSNHVGKKTCLVCNFIRTNLNFTTEACRETFKTQSGPLNFNSEKVLYLL